jgi:hypothetical protein
LKSNSFGHLDIGNSCLPAGRGIYLELGIWLLNSYMFKFKNFLLTFYAPSPFPSPQRGEGGGEGKFQIFLARIFPCIIMSNSEISYGG